MTDAVAPPVEGASLPELRLKHREDRRISAGHLWIFSNEVDTERTPLARFASGALCRVVGDRDRFLGYAYVNPHALICARILGRDPRHPPGQAAVRAPAAGRARAARAASRDALVPAGVRRVRRSARRGARPLRRRRRRVRSARPAWRHASTELARGARAGDRPGAVIWKNDGGARELEGLPSYVETALGEPPEHAWLEENGVRFKLPLGRGQKTGWFYDQAVEPPRDAARTRRARACSTCSRYLGAWGLAAARAGAREVLCVDSSAAALDAARRSPRLPTISASCARCATTRSMRSRRCAKRGRSSTSSSSTRRPSSSASATCRRDSRPIAS